MTELALPALLRSLGRYNPEDYGCLPGYTSTNKALNKAKFEAMLTEIGANGGGDIIMPDNIPTDQINFNHGGAGSRAINISARNGEGGFRFYGPTGPYLNIATSIGDRLDRCGIQDLNVSFADTPGNAAGAIRLGYCFGYDIEGLKMLLGDDDVAPEGQSSLGAVIGIESRMAFGMRRSKIELRTDVDGIAAAELTPIGILLSNPDDGGGPEWYDSEISGSGVGVASFGVRFAGGGYVDCPRMRGLLIKDHHTAFVCDSGGGFGNGRFSDLVLDGLARGLFLSPTGPVNNNHFSNTFISAFGPAISADAANDGDFDGLSFYGGHFTNSLTTCVDVATGVRKVRLFGIDMTTSINTSGNYGILMGGVSGSADGHTVQGCTVEVGVSATAAARFSTAATRMNVSGNTWVGRNAIQGYAAGVNGNVYANNGYA